MHLLIFFFLFMLLVAGVCGDPLNYMQVHTLSISYLLHINEWVLTLVASHKPLLQLENLINQTLSKPRLSYPCWWISPRPQSYCRQYVGLWPVGTVQSPSGQGAESSSSFAAKPQTPKNRSWEQGWNRVLQTGFMSNLSFLAQTSKTFIRDLREIWANSRKNIAKYGTFKQPLRSLWHCYAEHSELIYNNRDLKI